MLFILLTACAPAPNKTIPLGVAWYREQVPCEYDGATGAYEAMWDAPDGVLAATISGDRIRDGADTTRVQVSAGGDIIPGAMVIDCGTYPGVDAWDITYAVPEE